MKPSTLATLAALLASGCHSAAVPPAAPSAIPQPAGQKARAIEEVVGKPQAPVVIESALDGAVAHVTVRFPQGGAGVEVQASGAEGLSVSGAGPLARGRALAPGESLSFDVPFNPGAGESLLAVHVSGTFGGAHRTAVRAFPVGTRSALQRSKDVEGTTRIGGENVRVVPAEETQK